MSFSDESLGRSLAIVVGNTLIALSNKAMSAVPLDSEGEKRARRYFDELCVEINNGQYLDILGNIKIDVDLDWVVKTMTYKTAKYTVEKPLLIGASLAEAPEEVLAKLSEFAVPLGVAFQIQDDILGMFGSEERLGKPVDSDLKEGKKTLLTITLLKKLTSIGRFEEIERFRLVLGNTNLSREDYLWVQDTMRQTGTLSEVASFQKDLVSQAKDSLSTLKIDSSVRNYLLGIADFIVTREY